MTSKDFKAILEKRRLLLDGAMGTEILRRHKHCNASGFLDELCFSYPEIITEIHTDYINAGADIISTNTFNAYNSVELNINAARLARRAVVQSRKSVFVAGNLGPICDYSYTACYKFYRAQISALINGGVDILLFETVLNTQTLKAGLDAARDVSDYNPIMVSLTPTPQSESLQSFVELVSGYDNIVTLGLNCGKGSMELFANLQKLSKMTTCYLSVHPSAGLPDKSGEYPILPHSFAQEIAKMLDIKRVRIVGGCCGTTPAHIKALRELLA